MSTRSQPNNCPYCGDQNLWPHEADASPYAWECRSCLRAFTVQMLGQITRTEVDR